MRCLFAFSSDLTASGVKRLVRYLLVDTELTPVGALPPIVGVREEGAVKEEDVWCC